jgi:branched-chain amino acid transport system substrate-binding protein
MKTLLLGVALALAFAAAAGAQASEITIASVAPFTGPLSDNAEGNYIGAKAYFDSVNARGGVNGNKIRFIREDDKYTPTETLRLVELVAQRDKPVVFVNLLGSANVGLLLKEKTLEKVGVPAVGVTPGSEGMRNPGSLYLFHLQAGDNAQLTRLLDQLATIGIKRIAVVYQDNPFGKGGLKFLEDSVAKRGLEIVGSTMMALGLDDAKPAAKALATSKAQSYVLVLAPNSAASFVRDARAAGDTTPIYTMSYTPASTLVNKAGLAAATGVALAQVTPNPGAPTTGVVREYQEVLAKHAPAGTPFSSFSLAGFIAAKITVEGLKRSGAVPTTAKFVEAINGLRNVELGGYTIDFSSGNRVGSKYVNIGVVDHSGRLIY